MLELSQFGENWLIRRKLRKACQGARTESEMQAVLAATAPLRGKLLAAKSSELVGEAYALGITVVDIPLRFGSPLWREEGGFVYLSAEAEREIKKAIQQHRQQSARLVWHLCGLR